MSWSVALRVEILRFAQDDNALVARDGDKSGDLHRWGGLEGGLHLFSAQDRKILDTSKPQRNGRREASPRLGCK